ncbi:MAG: hypothetical protein ABIS11_01865 [Candidatus Dojkabacteria bacterium]
MTKSINGNWCMGPGCGQNQITAQSATNAAVTFGNPNSYATQGALNIVVVGEGSVTPAKVPYGSLVSTWDSNTKRSDSLKLCVNLSGCYVNQRGDYRTYQFPDGTNVPEDTLFSWAQSQMGSFPHAKSIQKVS